MRGEEREEEREKEKRKRFIYTVENGFVLTLLCEPVGGQEKKEGGQNHEKE